MTDCQGPQIAASHHIGILLIRGLITFGGHHVRILAYHRPCYISYHFGMKLTNQTAAFLVQNVKLANQRGINPPPNNPSQLPITPTFILLLSK